MIFKLKRNASSLYVAWGSPYAPQTAEKFMHKIASRSSHATARELCRSRAGRVVPMLHVRESELASKDRFSVGGQARQHAWESGSSWAAQGFAEWIVSDDPNAGWLRQHADIFVIPIMDIDNTATGNGGKNAIPHDHNRDWSPKPHWNETSALQRTDSARSGRGDARMTRLAIFNMCLELLRCRTAADVKAHHLDGAIGDLAAGVEQDLDASDDRVVNRKLDTFLIAD